jgi:hypothetical protein
MNITVKVDNYQGYNKTDNERVLLHFAVIERFVVVLL